MVYSFHKNKTFNTKKGQVLDSYTLVFVLTENCNLRCEYCYEKESIISNIECSMKQEFTLDKMIEVYNAFKQNFPKSKPNFTFFGGEPLLKKNLIIDFINYLNKVSNINSSTIGIISNGTLFEDSFINFSKKYIDYITISLDGTSMIHNEYRKTVNGKSTYDQVVESIRKLTSDGRKTNVALEMTVTDAYGKFYYDNLAYELWDMLISLNVGTVDFITVEGEKFSLLEYDIKNNTTITHFLVKSLIDIWYEHFLTSTLPFNIPSFENSMISLLKGRKSSICGAGRNYFAVFPDLSIYDCQVSKYSGLDSMGRIIDGQIIMENIDLFLISQEERYMVSNKICRKCKSVGRCGTYCKAVWKSMDKSTLKYPDSCVWHSIIENIMYSKIKHTYDCGQAYQFRQAVLNTFEVKY